MKEFKSLINAMEAVAKEDSSFSRRLTEIDIEQYNVEKGKPKSPPKRKSQEVAMEK